MSCRRWQVFGLVLGVACARGDAPVSRRSQAESTGSLRSAASPPESRVDALLRLGDSVYREDPDSARVLWTAALQGAKALGDSAAMARALTGLGQAARQLGDLRASRTLGERALALKLRLGLSAQLARSLNALGLLALDEERFVDAASLFARAAESAQAVGDAAAFARATINTGLVLDNLGSFAAARRALQAGSDLARIAADSVNYGRALTNLARLDVALGDPIAAVSNLETARRLFHATRDSTGEVNAIGQLATAQDALGDAQGAFALLDTAQRMAHRLGIRREEAEDLTLIGDLFGEAGDHRHALDYYGRALVATDSLGLPEERGNILRSAARAHAQLGNQLLAAQRAADALRLHRTGGFRSAQLEDRLLLAELAQAMQRPAESAMHLRDAKRLAALLDADVATARVALTEAQIALTAGDARTALRVLDDARASLGLLGAGATADAMAIRARAYGQLGQLDAAVAAGSQAIAAVEQIRGNYRSDELRTSYASGKAALYADQALRLLRLGRVEDAFRVADAARGRALLEHLAAARADIGVDDRVRVVLEKEELLHRIDALVAKLRARASQPVHERTSPVLAVTKSLSDSLVAARNEYEALVARSSNGMSSATSTLLGGGASLADVQAKLAADEALVEYLVTPAKLLTFVVTRSTLTTYEVRESAATLASRVRLARELLQQSPEDSAVYGVLRALHGVLLAPIEASGALRDVSRLVVVPHGVLAYVPFAALVDAQSARHLVERYGVLHASTAAAFVAMRSGVVTSARQPAERARGVVFAPFPDELPATRQESRSFVRAVPASTANIGALATEARLRSAIESGTIVHVATHAVMNPRNPLFSRIELAGDRGGPGADDGRLEVHELLGLRSSSPLVFLSGCETALGAAGFTPFDTGEDFTTIGQALLYAGARNVVATLWRIDDMAAAQFAELFYESLRSHPAVDALADAQRTMLHDPRFRSPYLWAAYEISGEGIEWASGANSLAASDKR